ncbi:MAG: DUF433 domain-containing protein [Vicinamibacteria bacterium]
MLDWSDCPAVERTPERLFDNLEAGARIDDFVEWFPGVTHEQVEAVLQHAELSLAQR